MVRCGILLLLASVAVRSDPLDDVPESARPLTIKLDKRLEVGEFCRSFDKATGRDFFAMPSIADREIGFGFERDNASLRAVLRLVAERTGLVWARVGAVHVLGRPEDIALVRGRSAWRKIEGLDATLDVDLDDGDVSDVAARIHEATGLEVTAEECAATFTLEAKDIAVADLLTLVLPEGWSVRRRRGRIQLRAPARLTFDYENEPATKVVTVVATYVQRPIQLDGELAKRHPTLKLVGVAWPEGLHRIAKSIGGVARPRADGSWRVAPAWKFDVERLLERKVSADVRGRGLGTTLRALAGPLPIALDAGLEDREVRVQAVDLTLERVLAVVTQPEDLAWDVRWGGVLLATPARLAALPIAPRFRGVPDKTVKVAFLKMPLPQTRKYLENATGVRFVIAPEAADAFEAGRVTVSGKLALRHVLAAMLVPYDLTAKAVDGEIRVEPR